MGLFGRKRQQADGAGHSGGSDARGEFERGKREFEAGHFDTAAAVFRTVVAVTPDSPNSQFLLGASLFKAGNPRAAVAPLRRSVAMPPEHAQAQLFLGMSLGRLEEFDEADEHLARAASLGEVQARQLLPQMGFDYCRTCARPAYFRQGDAGADIVVADIGTGTTCTRCGTVLCGTCASGGQLGARIMACPDCDGPLRMLTG